MTRPTPGSTFPGFYPEGPQYPVASRAPRHHRNDPDTSRQAAAAIKPVLGKLQQEALALVTCYPGRTAHELDRIYGKGDGVTMARRLSDLKKAGLAYTKGTRPNPVTGNACACWWAVDGK